MRLKAPHHVGHLRRHNAALALLQSDRRRHSLWRAGCPPASARVVDIDTPRIGGLGTFRKDIDQVVRLAGECGAYAPMATRAAEVMLEASRHDHVGTDPDVSRIIALFLEARAPGHPS